MKTKDITAFYNMPSSDIKKSVTEMQGRYDTLSAEEHFLLYLGLLKLELIDKAMFQAEFIAKYMRDEIIESDFVAEIPGLKERLKGFWGWLPVWVEEGCGAGGEFGFACCALCCCLCLGYSPCADNCSACNVCSVFHGWCFNCDDGGCSTACCEKSCCCCWCFEDDPWCN